MATKTLGENRVAVFIVSYNAERHIERVLARIPDWVARALAEVYIIDDSSKDATVERAKEVVWDGGKAPLAVFKTPYNQGYGGNQRLGYLYALERGFDIVVLLHGDGQYAPESLPEILAEYSRPDGADAVYGSRFMTKGGALRGRMPLYKFVGNRILTWLQNRIIGTRLSELHSGYRSYRTAALRKVPFQVNSLGFDFDSDIIIQFAAANLRIREVPIPTYYGDEICHVNGLKYAWACIKAACQYRLMQLEIFYNPKFDIPNRVRKYTIKASPTSIHHCIRSLDLATGSTLLDLGGGDGSAVSMAHADRGVAVTVLDQHVVVSDEVGTRATTHPNIHQFPADLDGDWPGALPDVKFSTVFVLDVLEHMKSPERAAQQIFSVMAPGGKLYASTGNIAFWVIRAIHLLGHFNYGRRGILDLTHTRLFTVSSFRRVLRNAGFRIDAVGCFGPPIADLAGGRSGLLAVVDRVFYRLARLWKGLFGYQILIEATRPDSVEDLMQRTFNDHRDGSGRSFPEVISSTSTKGGNAQSVSPTNAWPGSAPDSAAQPATSRSGWNQLTRLLVLAVVPALLLLAASVHISVRGPFALIKNSDPSYVYLANGLLLLEGIRPFHTDHPGTPVQILGAATLALKNFPASATEVVQETLAHPEAALATIQWVLVALALIGLLGLGVAVDRRSGSLPVALAVQASVFAVPAWLNSYNWVSPEPMLIGLVLIYSALLVWRDAQFATQRTSMTRLIWVGIVAGIALATKLTFLPLCLLGLFPWPGVRQAVVFVCTVVVTAFLCLLPVVGAFPRMGNWIASLMSHTGRYGGGAQGFIDPAHFLNDVRAILSLAPIWPWLWLISLLFGATVAWYSRTHATRRLFSWGVGVVTVQITTVLMIAKHPGSQYLYPALITTPLLFAVMFLTAFSLPTRRLRTMGLFVPACLLAVVLPRGFSQLQSQYEAAAKTTEHYTTFLGRAQTLAAGSRWVDCFGSSTSTYALYFANEWAYRRYSTVLTATHPGYLLYNSNNSGYYGFREQVPEESVFQGVNTVYYFGYVDLIPLEQAGRFKLPPGWTLQLLDRDPAIGCSYYRATLSAPAP